ncbi:hypothetical protein Q3G72_001559 [Acer saccharum]|nr:hypothetical protein Q3G72_001559 [Acer saccharum]
MDPKKSDNTIITTTGVELVDATIPKPIPKLERPEPITNVNTPIDVDEPEHDDTKKRKLKSVVWNHFSKQKIEGLNKAVCNYCKKKLAGSSRAGTKHLHDHFRICPLRQNKDIKQSLLNPNNQKHIDRVRKMCYDLVNEYQVKYSDGQDTLPMDLQVPSMEDVHEHDIVDPLAAYDLFVSSTSNVDGVKFNKLSPLFNQGRNNQS